MSLLNIYVRLKKESKCAQNNTNGCYKVGHIQRCSLALAFLQLTSKTIIKILKRLLLLLPAHPGGLGVFGVGVVVEPQLVEGLGGLVLPGSVSLRFGRK
jgi:hypothetical protein